MCWAGPPPLFPATCPNRWRRSLRRRWASLAEPRRWPSSIPATSLTRYIDLLQAVFLVQLVPAWSSEQDTRFTKTPKAYLVDEDFPAITPTMLHGTVPRVELVSNVSYRLDITDLDFDRPPSPLDTYVEIPKGTL